VLFKGARVEAKVPTSTAMRKLTHPPFDGCSSSEWKDVGHVAVCICVNNHAATTEKASRTHQVHPASIFQNIFYSSLNVIPLVYDRGIAQLAAKDVFCAVSTENTCRQGMI
jgi:hypothetical protein